MIEYLVRLAGQPIQAAVYTQARSPEEAAEKFSTEFDNKCTVCPVFRSESSDIVEVLAWDVPPARGYRPILSADGTQVVVMECITQKAYRFDVRGYFRPIYIVNEVT